MTTKEIELERIQKRRIDIQIELERERILGSQEFARRYLCVVDVEKLITRLTQHPDRLEVAPFNKLAWELRQKLYEWTWGEE